MKKHLLLCLLLFAMILSKAGFIQHEIAQIPRQAFLPVQLFQPRTGTSENDILLKKDVSHYDLLRADSSTLKMLANTELQAVEIAVPIDGVWETIQLIQSHTVSENTIFTAKNSFGEEVIPYKKGVYYHGIVKNKSNSIVAVSFFENDIIGVIGTDNGNYVLGRENLRVANNDQYIIYNDRDLQIPSPNNCATDDDHVIQRSHKSSGLIVPETITTNCVKVYIECDNQFYLDHSSSTTSSINFATGIFNLTNALYLNDSISTGISQVSVWTTTDPYISATSTSTMLNLFGAQVSAGFNGDLAHLFSTRSLGGGVAWVDVLCDIPQNETAVSASLGSTLTPLPTYSWNANVVTHEMGHNLGSFHTHSCVWNGNNTRIDNCGGHAGYTSGTCADVTPDPAGGGTMMSYCHLVSGIGINFNLGFGPQPGTLIRAKVNAATCLSPCITCNSNIVISGTYSTPLTESNTWIKSTTQTTILNSASVVLDANPTNGYVLIQPGTATDFFLASPASTGKFVAQALDGCAGFQPARLHGINTGTQAEVQQSLSLFPNPADQQISIVQSDPENALVKVEIVSLQGQIQQSQTNGISPDRFELNVHHLASGLYIVKIYCMHSVESIRFEKH